jgi:phosphoserine phosphatase
MSLNGVIWDYDRTLNSAGWRIWYNLLQYLVNKYLDNGEMRKKFKVISMNMPPTSQGKKDLFIREVLPLEPYADLVNWFKDTDRIEEQVVDVVKDFASKKMKQSIVSGGIYNFQKLTLGAAGIYDLFESHYATVLLVKDGKVSGKDGEYLDPKEKKDKCELIAEEWSTKVFYVTDEWKDIEVMLDSELIEPICSFYAKSKWKRDCRNQGIKLLTRAGELV